MRLILASASPARAKILSEAGVNPEIIAANIDEAEFTASLPDDFSDEQIVVALAQRKAITVIDENALRNCVVIACDSMLSLEGELLGKPITVDNARARWYHMRGKTGFLVTGHAVVVCDAAGGTRMVQGASTTAVRFAMVTDQEVEAYIASGEPLLVAGAFTLDAKGGWFIDHIDGDPSSVIGLSLPLVRKLLHELGLSPIMMWDCNKKVGSV